MSNLWKVVPEKTEAGWWLEVEDPDGWRRAAVRRDGCIHYNRYFDRPLHMRDEDDDDPDYLHICDIDDEIARLRELKAEAIKHFGPDWPNL